MATTNETLTTTQIRALRDKAVAASDHALAAVCDRAGDLGGNWIDTLTGADLARVRGMTQDDARAECARVVAAAHETLTVDQIEEEIRARRVPAKAFWFAAGVDPMPLPRSSVEAAIAEAQS